VWIDAFKAMFGVGRGPLIRFAWFLNGGQRCATKMSWPRHGGNREAALMVPTRAYKAIFFSKALFGGRLSAATMFVCYRIVAKKHERKITLRMNADFQVPPMVLTRVKKAVYYSKAMSGAKRIKVTGFVSRHSEGQK
jgi:hypothetical protein